MRKRMNSYRGIAARRGKPGCGVGAWLCCWLVSVAMSYYEERSRSIRREQPGKQRKVKHEI